MKKTQIIEILKNFKKTFVTFFCIVLFVSFGVAAFLGLDWSRESLADSLSGYFSEGNLQEEELSYALGIDDDDMAFLDTVQEIGEKEGRYEAFRFMNLEGRKNQIHLYSITDKVNRITSLEGKRPSKPDEILVEKAYAENCGIEIGDKIEFSADDKDSQLLKNSSFKVSGIVKTAEYTSVYSDTYGVNPETGCAVKGIMYLDKTAFETALFPGYTSVLLKCADLENAEMFTDAYNHRANRLTEHIQKKLEEHFQSRYMSLSPKSANSSYILAKSISDIFSRLRVPLAGLFVIVGALVCFFAVARNVYDQSKLIGTKKALGFYRREIMVSFLIFSLLSTIIGLVLGTVLARFGVENLIVKAIQSDYPFNELIYAFSMKSVLLFAFFEIAIILISTYFAAAGVLKMDANSLLNGGKKHSFGEKFYMKTRAFRKMSVFGKTIVNNMFGEPGRTFSTIVGVMGITALVVSSLSLNNFIQGALDRQMDEITKYDTVLYINQNEKDTSEIEAFLDSKGLTYNSIMSSYVTLETPDDQKIATSIYVVEDDGTFLKLFDLHDGKNGFEKIDGLYSSVSYREEFRPDPGDEFCLTDAFGQKHEISVAGFFDYHLVQNQLIIDKETYEKEFGGSFAANSIILDRGKYTLSALSEKLSEYEGFINADDYCKLSKESFNSFAAVFKLVLGVYIALAALMALVVILNLLDMYIKEKKYELIVLRINGFSSGKVKSYIYIDTIFLTLAGAAAGIVLGVIMGNLSLDAYRTASLYFEGGFNLPAVAVGTGLTFALVFLVTIFSIKKIDRFKLGDINA